MIVYLQKLPCSGLRIITTDGGIALTAPEVEKVCSLLPGLFPGYFGLTETISDETIRQIAEEAFK